MIPQIQAKFKFDEKKAKDLAEIPQNNAVVKENLTTQNPQDYTTLQKQLFGNSEQLKNTSNMDTENAVVEKNLATENRDNIKLPQKAQTLLQNVKEQAQKHNNIIFTDTKGKEHMLTKEVQQQWLNTFNLKSLDEAYIPQLPKEAKEALGGKEIRLQLGSLKKLVSQGREQFIPQIKAVLDEPEAILKDIDEGFLFIKHLKDNDYFVNVSYDKGEYLVSVSNGIKEVNNLENKLKAGAKILYQSPSFSSSRNKLLQTSQYSTNKIDNNIIPQNAGGKIFGKKVNHPGTKASPYLENAANRYINSSGFTRAKSALANEVKNRIVNDIKKAVK